MSLVIKQIKLYAKLTLIIALALIVVMVVFKNRKNEATVWFFGTYESIKVLWLLLCTAVGSIAAWWILGTTLGVWRDLRDVYRASEVKRRTEQLEKRAEELADAEKRIDEKLKRAKDSDSD